MVIGVGFWDFIHVLFLPILNEVYMENLQLLKIYPGKTIPLLISGFLTYRIYTCPCEKLMACNKVSSVFLISSLLVMTLGGWPLK
jgi:hypothetical protein